MNRKKCGIALLTALILIYALCVTVFAQEIPDLGKEGEISVTMRYQGNVVPGGSLTIYKVGTVFEDDGNYGFKLSDEFAGSKVDLTNLSSADLPERLVKYIKNQNISGKTQNIDSDGKIVFPGLLPGLYLIVQEKAAEGYNNAKPFLVSLPYYENGVYEYTVDASPKVELEKAPKEDPPSPPSPPSLPQTGQLNWPIPILVVSGLFLFAVGWVLRFRKER